MTKRCYIFNVIYHHVVNINLTDMSYMVTQRHTEIIMYTADYLMAILYIVNGYIVIQT